MWYFVLIRKKIISKKNKKIKKLAFGRKKEKIEGNMI